MLGKYGLNFVGAGPIEAFDRRRFICEAAKVVHRHVILHDGRGILRLEALSLRLPSLHHHDLSLAILRDAIKEVRIHAQALVLLDRKLLCSEVEGAALATV